MSARLFGYSIFIALFIISGCSMAQTNKVTIDSINAEEVLRLDPNADIFQYDGVIYQTDIKWVDELNITKHKQVGEINVLNTKNTDFKDFMANKLPVGTKLFSVKGREDILIVELHGKILKYLAIVEG